MKIIKFIVIITSILLVTLNAQSTNKNDSKPTITKSYVKCRNVETIVVPNGKSENVLVDGTFTKKEWDDALSYSVAENYKIYLKIDSEIL